MTNNTDELNKKMDERKVSFAETYDKVINKFANQFELPEKLIKTLKEKREFGLEKYGERSFQSSFENAMSSLTIDHLQDEIVDAFNYSLHSYYVAKVNMDEDLTVKLEDVIKSLVKVNEQITSLKDLWKENEVSYFYPDIIDVTSKNPTLPTLEVEAGQYIWEGGNWTGGAWTGGIWKTGNWKNGIWKSGTWEDGTWESGTWKDGTWENGTWEKGTWLDGTWSNGTWKAGTWEDGLWKDGVWLDGIWESGTWENGIWVNGIWENGFWKTGFWKTGNWKNGIWKSGLWESGTWEDGIWESGTWDDGVWETGVWLDGKIWNPRIGSYKYSTVPPNKCEWSLSYEK